MRIKILGSAAGGGLPQWNCSCANCWAVRSGAPNAGVRARTQTQVAITTDDRHWFLLNCSPDLRTQIEGTPELHSQPANGARHSPISGAVITSADVDCVVGLLHLRELQPLTIYSTATVRHILRDCNSSFRMLEQRPDQTRWIDFAPGQDIELASPDGINSRIRCRAVATGGDWPVYVTLGTENKLPAGDASLGLIIEGADTEGESGQFAFLPSIREVGDELLQALDSCDLILMDGTFWSDDELIRIQGGGRTAREMGHMPISGAGGSMERMRELHGPRKVFIHVNNTNPMLNECSAEYAQVREAGWEIAEDGWEFVSSRQHSVLSIQA